MARTRWVLLLTFLALAAVLLAPHTTVLGPFVPTSPDQVVETVRARAAAKAVDVDAGLR